MLHKISFTLEVDLYINKVTCPGVWLCPYGRLSLEVYLLGSCVQTARIKPSFPLEFNEQYLFRKTFTGSLHEIHLNGTLNKEYVYMELVQWECDGDYGGVLASFRCSLYELLIFPCVENAQRCNCNVLELLMQPSKSFPGILSPKIEISTESNIKGGLHSLTSISDGNAISGCSTSNKARTPSPSRKVLCQLRQHSCCTSTSRQRRVCHSTNYHKSRKCFPKMQNTKPTFSYRKPDTRLFMRESRSLGAKKCTLSNEYSSVATVLRDCISAVSSDDILQHCGVSAYCRRKPITPKKVGLSTIVPPSNYSRKYCARNTIYSNCLCSDEHDMDACSTCWKYMYYFDCKCCKC